MHYIFCYDFANDSLRTHLANVLERHGCVRLQYSVWFTPEWTPKKLRAFRAVLQKLFVKYAARKTTSDSVLCLPLTSDCLSELIWEGDTTTLQTALTKIALVWL